MTREQKQLIRTFREAGLGYGAIAQKLMLPESTVKTFCRRGAISMAAVASHCVQCGCELANRSLWRKMRFCSDLCRMGWWHSHRVTQTYVCAECGTIFSADNTRKYCSHACYIRARFGKKEQL